MFFWDILTPVNTIAYEHSLPMDNDSWIIFDGSLISADRPVVPAVSRGLMYGDGVFETFRTYSGKTFLLDQHFSRLQKGLEELDITRPKNVRIGQLESLVSDLLQKNELFDRDAIVRMQVWRDGKRGYQPETEGESHVSITVSECPDSFSYPQLVTVDTKRIPSASMPSNYKFTNGINYILAAQEASNKGGDDALMQTVNGWISETTIANIFWIKGNTVFTPSADCDLIPGITRNVILELIGKDDTLNIDIGKFDLDQLLQADAVWLCNSVRELLPVQKIDNHSFSVANDTVSELKHHFKKYRDQHLKSL